MTRHLVWLGAALALPAAWFVIHFGHLAEAPLPVALAAGAGIFGAAFLISWAAEVAQLDIPRALAVAFLALIAVLPEYAVDIYFAWQAGQRPEYTAYATANMTGANRLLIGFGWATAMLALWLRHRQGEVVLPREQAVEINYLALATLYSFVIPIKGTLSLVDTAILFTMFVLYMRAASRAHHEEPELEGPAELIARLAPGARRLVTVAIGLLAGAAIFTAAEPFAESLLEAGEQFGIEKFLLVQWIAPLASESPEFIVAILFALRGSAAASIGTLVSSTVNQWTLLVGALPAAFSLSSGGPAAMVLDGRQREEILLTSAQSLFALIVIADFRFSLSESLLLLALFVPQLWLTSTAARWGYATLYLLLAVVLVAASASARRGALRLLPRLRRPP